MVNKKKIIPQKNIDIKNCVFQVVSMKLRKKAKKSKIFCKNVLTMGYKFTITPSTER